MTVPLNSNYAISIFPCNLQTSTLISDNSTKISKSDPRGFTLKF